MAFDPRSWLKFQDHPLADYLARPQDAYAWIERSRRQTGCGEWTGLHLISQTWQGRRWEHRLEILTPRGASQPGGGPGFLFITGDEEDGEALEMVERLMEKCGAQAAPPVAAVLYDVPNQPLFDGLVEDALIAYSFVHYLDSGDPTWPLLFPMVRSASAAVTAIQEWNRSTGARAPEQFVVSGASKRGWTTWLLGAADARAAGIAPLVYNNLNIPAQMRRQVASFHEYSEEINDYVAAGLPERMNTPEGQRLVAMVDPYFLREHLSLPKLLIHGANDRYWPVDAAGLYLDDLPGETRLLTAPNAGHSLEDRERVLPTMAAFLRSVASGTPLPAVRSRLSGRNWDCTLEIGWNGQPAGARAWTAVAPDRDFRDSAWMSTSVSVTAAQAEFRTRLPATGCLALFAEMDYEEDGHRYTLTTAPAVIPSTPE